MTRSLDAVLVALGSERARHGVLLDAEGVLTGAELKDRALQFAARLSQAGGRPGDVLALHGLSVREHWIALLGSLSAGCVVFPLSARDPAPALALQLKQAGAAGLVSGDAATAKRLKGTHGLDAPMALVAPPGSSPLPHGAATILCTSGSSGTPKYAVHPLTAYAHSAELAGRALHFARGATWRLSLPLHHVGGLGILMRALFCGGRVEVPPAGRAPWEELRARDVTHLSLVPTQLVRALEVPEAAQELRVLRAILLGGAPLSRGLRKQALASGLALRVGYGSTETTGMIAVTRDPQEAATECCAGVPVSPGTVRVDPTGEIRVSGAALFLGYLGTGGLSSPLDEQGSLATGDLGSIDPKGRLFVTGRKDRMFISGGENVHPEEIERALCELPGVHDAVVHSEADKTFGQVPVANVRADAGVDLAGLPAALRRTLPGFKVPRAIGVLAAPDAKTQKLVAPAAPAARRKSKSKVAPKSATKKVTQGTTTPRRPPKRPKRS